MLLEGSEGPLGSFSIFLRFGVFHKLFRVFVHAKVGQMDESFACVFCFDVVLVGGESSKPFFEHINPQRIVASYNNVDSEIVLEVVDEMGVSDVI